MEFKIMSWFFAASPIILFLTLILGMKWSGSSSGALANTATPCGEAHAQHQVG